MQLYRGSVERPQDERNMCQLGKKELEGKEGVNVVVKINVNEKRPDQKKGIYQLSFYTVWKE